MKPTTAFLMIVSAAALVACGKSEEAAAPEPVVTETPALEAPVTPPANATAAVADAVVETAPAETPTPVTKPAIEAPAPAVPPASPAPVAAAPAAVPSPTVADLVHGQTIYRQACAFCHDKGVAGAPKTGDAAAWTARIAQGMDTLYAVAIKGKGAMPAKGGNPALSETDVKAAVDFMIAQSR